jgi:hypothetical protein
MEIGRRGLQEDPDLLLLGGEDVEVRPRTERRSSRAEQDRAHGRILVQRDGRLAKLAGELRVNAVAAFRPVEDQPGQASLDRQAESGERGDGGHAHGWALLQGCGPADTPASDIMKIDYTAPEDGRTEGRQWTSS